jgi:spermidine/putrescine transport system substrate-binding protein
MKPMYAWRRICRRPSLLALLAGLLCLAPAVAAEAKRELVVLTWADYLDPEVAAAFQAKCDCSLKLVYFETDDARDQLMVESGGAGYDVVMLNGLMVQTYRQRGWLSPIDPAQIPNLVHVDSQWRDAFDGTREYGVPYFWGTMGIAYRKDLAPEPITRWEQLMRPHEALRGRITMIDSARDLITSSLKSLGASVNSTDPGTLQAAKELLLAQRPYVKSYSYVALTEESSLVTGEVIVAMMFNGDALMVQEHNPNIVFVLPEEGGQLWVDYWVVPDSSKNKDLAMAFVNFLNEPSVAADNAQFVHYATPNLAAEGLLPADFLADPVVYPPAEMLKHSEYYTELPPRVERVYSDIFTTVVE